MSKFCWSVLTENGIYEFRSRAKAREFARKEREQGKEVLGPDSAGAKTKYVHKMSYRECISS